VEIVGTVDRTVDSNELVQIQLAPEALKLGLIEVLGHDMLHESINVMDFESCSTSDPRNKLIESFNDILK
jgi:hypothetical protein